MNYTGPKLEDEYKKVACLRCGSDIGQACRSANMKPLQMIHKQRKALYYLTFLESPTARAITGTSAPAKPKNPLIPDVETFCTYCQEDYGDGLREHVLAKHPGTYRALVYRKYPKAGLVVRNEKANK